MNSVAEAQHPEVQTPTEADSQQLPARRRWTVEEYHRMGEVGLLGENDRVELIEGDVVEMAPIGSEHAGHLNDLNRCFAMLMAQRKAMVAIQNPVALAEDSEPQPDVALLHWRDDCYKKSHPRPDEILLLIEVADSSIHDDRAIKVPLYARNGIPELWLLDLPQKRLEVYRDPVNGQYRQITEHRTGSVAPAAFPGSKVELAELFSSL